MRAISLRVDELTVETRDESTSPEGLPPILLDAFNRLAQKLQDMPAARRERLDHRVLSHLTIQTLPVDALLGPRGAERLAEELYKQLLQEPFR